MKQKFDWNLSTEEVEKVLKGTYDNEEDAELTEIMKLVLTNCVETSPPKKTNPEITVAQLQRKMNVEKSNDDISKWTSSRTLQKPIHSYR